MKKIVCVIMAILLVAMTFTACGAPAATSSVPATEAPATEAPATEAPKTEAPATEAPATDAPAAGDFAGKYLAGKGTKEDGSAYKIGLLHANLESEYVIYLSEYAKFLFEQAGCEVIQAQSGMSQETEDGYIEDFIEAGVDCVVMDAVDSNGSSASVKKLTAAGIPVVCTIRTIEGVDYELFVSTSDNVKTGEKCMNYVAELANGENVDVTSVQGYMGASDAYLREEGYQNILKDNSNISYTSTDCNWSSTDAEAAISDALTANPNLWGIASHSACLTAGVYSALTQAGVAKKVGEDGHVVWCSIDGAAADLEMIREGYMDATVDQSPLTNAVTCVKGVLDYILQGKDLEGKQIDVETTVVTSENVNDPGWWGDYDIEDSAKGIFWDGTEDAWNGAVFE